jgi:hypothetical protein
MQNFHFVLFLPSRGGYFPANITFRSYLAIKYHGICVPDQPNVTLFNRLREKITSNHPDNRFVHKTKGSNRRPSSMTVIQYFCHRITWQRAKYLYFPVLWMFNSNSILQIKLYFYGWGNSPFCNHHSKWVTNLTNSK